MTDEELQELDELKRRVLTLEHQHSAILATVEKLIRRVEAAEAQAK